MMAALTGPGEITAPIETPKANRKTASGLSVGIMLAWSGS
jgi:hypothetical protein